MMNDGHGRGAARAQLSALSHHFMLFPQTASIKRTPEHITITSGFYRLVCFYSHCYFREFTEGVNNLHRGCYFSDVEIVRFCNDSDL